ncbi:neprilysin-1-like [Rhipicephalus microplus]|uniref:neprilysin-1-like n=1 Tax=Rhipicephalus microplus TaxID=6941 RepID=UPI003F6D8200
MRDHAFGFLRRMKGNIKSLINDLSWMNEESKRVAFSKLDNMKRVVMPHNDFFLKRDHEVQYSVFPDMNGKNFMTNLLGCSKVYQHLRNYGRFQGVYNVRTFPDYGRGFYSYLPNSMTFAIGDLNLPLFYYVATLAIKYGALGSIAGQQMSKRLDETGVTVDVTDVRGVWLKLALAAVRAEKSNCDVHAMRNSTKWRPLRVFPVVDGLEVAYASFTAAVTLGYPALDDFRTLHLENFTDKQIFFLAFCYRQCSKRPQTGGDECNVPAENSLLFAEAFSSPSNSPVNPPKK